RAGDWARASNASFASSKAATACSCVTVGKSAKNSASGRPRSRYSRSVCTGTRAGKHRRSAQNVRIDLDDRGLLHSAEETPASEDAGGRAGGRHSSAANDEDRNGPVRSNGAPKHPVRLYRLSAVCQPTLQTVVAGARNQHYLQLWRPAA